MKDPLWAKVLTGAVVGAIIGRVFFSSHTPAPRVENNTIGERLPAENCFFVQGKGVTINVGGKWYHTRNSMGTYVDGFAPFCNTDFFKDEKGERVVWPVKLEGEWYLCKGVGTNMCMPVWMED